MSYNSTFEVRVKPLRPPPPNVVQYFQQTPLLRQVLVAIEQQADMPMYPSSSPDEHLRIGDTTWYDFEGDLRAVSRSFPNAVLEVTRYGEDGGDIARRYFSNGQVGGGKAEIVFPPNPFEATSGK